MLLTKLAEKLIAAKSAAERTRLLSANKKQAGEKLARKIKDICYAAWTSRPAEARKASLALKSLYNFNPRDDIKALSLWIAGVAELTKGKLEAAIGDLDSAAAFFNEIDHEHDAAQTQVAKLIALALLGRYDEAVRTGESLLKILEKYGDELTAGKVEKNLGNIVSRQDRHFAAERYYLSARKRFRRLGEKVEQVMAENGLAITYTHLNDFRKAETFFTHALKNAYDGDMTLTSAEIEASMGNLALFRGKYDQALKYFELSRRKYEALDMPHQTAVASLEIAGIYKALNLTREAFEIFGEVAEVFRRLKLQGEEARARENFGRVALLLGELSLARREFKRAAELYELEKNRNGAAAVKLEEARISISQENFSKAFRVIAEAEALLAESESFRDKLALKLLKAEALAGIKDSAGAETLLSQTKAEATRQQLPDTLLSALNALGKLALDKGENNQAKTYFKKAAVIVERLRAPLTGEEFRIAFLANKLGPFESLATIYLSENKITAAFSQLERSRSRALADDVAGGSQNHSGTSPELSEKLSRLREELNWYYSRLDRAGNDEITMLQKEAQRREKEIAILMRQIESTAQKSGAGAKNLLDLASLRKRLGKKKLLVEFVSFDGMFSAFIVDDKKVSYSKDLASNEEILSLLEGLQFQFGALRYGASVPEKFAAELKKRADLYLQKLYAKLLQPLEKHFGARDLVVVPAGSLYYVPFHALHNGEKYVIEDREVVYSPSAAVWQTLQSKRKRKLERILLMGFADERIPLVDCEIAGLKKLFPAAKSFIGKDASFAAYTKNAPKSDLLHLACHGQFRPENPLFSSLHLADGWVTVRDICAQILTADLVTLSACETGLHKIFAGDEIVGLARGFLAAGANSLIMSLWTVNDAAAAELMADLYKNLQRGRSVSASLKIAQNEFIGRGEHPYFWSPFMLIGH